MTGWLGQLVQPKSPEPFPDARDPIAVVLLPLGLGAARGVHGPELDQPEGQPGQPHALLDEEHGTAGVELDQQHDQDEDGRQHDQAHDGHEEAEGPRERQVRTRYLEVGGEDDTARRHRLQRELPGQALVGRRGVLDHDAARPRLEERVDRQTSPPLGERDDDAIGQGRFDHAIEVLGVIHHADDLVSEIGPPLDFLDDLAPEGAAPEDQHPLAVTPAPDAVTQA